MKYYLAVYKKVTSWNLLAEIKLQKKNERKMEESKKESEREWESHYEWDNPGLERQT